MYILNNLYYNAFMYIYRYTLIPQHYYKIFFLST